MSDDETGPGGTLVIPPEENPAHRPAEALTAEDEDPATRIAEKSAPPLQPSPTVQLEVPSEAYAAMHPPTPTMKMDVVGTPPRARVLEVAFSPRPGSRPGSRSGADPGRLTPPPQGPSKFVPLVVGVMVALGVGGVGMWLALRGTPSSKLLHEAAVMTAGTTDESEVATLPSPPSTGTSATPSTRNEVDDRARAALQRFRDGLKGCVENTIHKLPGTSPPVPDGLGWLKHGPYTSLKRDWASPVFACVHFQMDEPMQFMIQWQADRDGAHGTGIVWVDGNDDGVADSAYAFTATASGGSVVTSEIASVDPAKATVHPP